MRKLILALILILALNFNAQAENIITSKAQLNAEGMKVVTGEGSAAMLIIENELPKAELIYISTPQSYEEVKQGKIDACIEDRNMLELAVKNGLNGVKILDENMSETVKIAVGISRESKIKDLKDNVNKFIAEIKADGTLNDMYARWVVNKDYKMPDIKLNKNNNKLIIGTTGIYAPYSFYKGTELVGLDIELAYRFALWLDADIEFKVYDFAGLVTAAATGKINLAMSNLNITRERAEVIDFSDVLFEMPVGILVKAPEQAQEQNNSIITHKSQLNAKVFKVGVNEGSAAVLITENELPNANLVYLAPQDAYEAVKRGMIDAYIFERSNLEIAINQGLKGVRLLDNNMDESVKIAVGISRKTKIKDLKDNINKFIAEIKADGTLNDMYARWVVNKDYKMPDIKLNKNNNKLIIGTTGIYAPYSFYKGTELTGFDIELAYRFADYLGYDLEFKTYNFAGLITATAAGKVDLAMSDLNVTKERQEAIDFSDSLFEMPVGILVRDNKAQASQSLKLFNNKNIKIGVSENGASQFAVKNELPDAELVYLDIAPGYEAAAAGKIDAYAYERNQMKLAIKNGLKGVRLLDEDFDETLKVAVGISPKSKIKNLQANFNKFLAEIKAGGIFDDMLTRWVEQNNYNRPDIKLNLNNNNKLIIGTTGTVPPYSFYKGNELTGFDIELAYRFADYLGYDLEFKVYDFAGLVTALTAGNIDLAMSNLQVTKEREEAILFSDLLEERAVTLLVKEDDNNIIKPESEPELKTFNDLNNKRVSMLTGAPFADLVKSKAPDVSEFTYFNSMTDMLQALKSNKTDAILMNNAVLQLAVNKNSDVKIFPESLGDSAFGLAFNKANKANFNLWQNAFNNINKAEIKAAWDKWTGADDSVKTLIKQDWPGANGTITAAVGDTLEPMCYLNSQGEAVGFDCEIILLIAKELDLHVNFINMDLASVMSYVASGKADVGAASIVVSPERKQSTDFIEYYPAAFLLGVRAAQQQEAQADLDLINNNFWEEIKASFNKTFIREGRYRLFIDGVLVTLLITCLSCIFGTALGFIIFIICRKHEYKLVNLFFGFIQGTPMVVLLMILYYIIFGKLAISGVFTAVIAFTLSLSAGVYGLLKIGVGAIDRGQYEAAYALGYSDLKTFFKIILPQALPHVINAYRGEIIAMLKGTAIVGYIAVMDLTKIGDVVRARTYEPFFPLIALTIIYFILEFLIFIIIKHLQNKLDYKNRKPEEILSGVVEHN